MSVWISIPCSPACLFQNREKIRLNENADAPGFAGDAFDQPGPFEVENHLVHGRWSDTEVFLHVGLGGQSAVYLRVDVDKGQVLALSFGEPGVQGIAGRSRLLQAACPEAGGADGPMLST